jgi:UDP-2,3-diacylglucosamine pyrophosphatase LpxH
MGKKILVIGDVHGNDGWKPLVEYAFLNFIDVIFVGDYVDSFTLSTSTILHNLKEIIDLKKKHADKVTLLLGNHDWAYIHDRNGISGFKWQVWQDYKKLFNDNKELFQIAWGYYNSKSKKYTLGTHAGLTYNYYKRYILTKCKDEKSKYYQLCEGDPSRFFLDEILNWMINDDILWKVGSMRGGVGTPSPLWADYAELLEDPYPDINQFFGHTASGSTSIFQNGDHFIAKIDGHLNKQTTHMILNI